MVAARRAIARRGEPLRGGVCREHGNAFDAQRPAIHDVVVVALHRQELAVADGGDQPHLHEQKLQEEVNSLTSESFKSFVAARIAGTSSSPPIANPVPPPTVNFSKSRG